ncbi:agmatine deiminase family protein [Helicobacter jaachi]|nr:agmatine deiminase family protein [Helicobacter jaachi]
MAHTMDSKADFGVDFKAVRLKAEWERQVATLMAFPHKNSDWAAHLSQAQQSFIDIIKQILHFQSVILCVDSEDAEGLALLKATFYDTPQRAPVELNADSIESTANLAQTHLAPAQAYINAHFNESIARECICLYALDSIFGLYIVRVGTNDTWARDFGGISIESKHGIKMLDFTFNGWGLKYPANKDNQITRHLFKKDYLLNADMVLEGGSIDSNGNGILLTNTQCLLEPNRNAHLSQADIESKLKHYFNIHQILWLHYGYLAGDDTDSHIDTLARFIAPDSIAYIVCEDKQDEHFEHLARMQAELQALRQKNGEPFKLIALPFTKPIFDANKERLPASYANFLFVNDALLVPTYSDENDERALQILQAALPKHKVVGVDCRTLILWHGSLHCISMQLYADNPSK